MTDPVTAKSIADLRGMSKDDLVAAHDGMIKLGGYVEDPENYRAELARRDPEQQTHAMLFLTKCIARLTVANVVLVAYSVLH